MSVELYLNSRGDYLIRCIGVCHDGLIRSIRAEKALVEWVKSFMLLSGHICWRDELPERVERPLIDMAISQGGDRQETTSDLIGYNLP
jgi:hypothetical protein